MANRSKRKKNAKTTTGRKPLLVEKKELVDELVKLIQTGMTDAEACEYVGIARSTFYGWLQKGRDELTRVEQAKADGKHAAKVTKDKQIYVEFLDRITRARVATNRAAVTAIRGAIIGHKEVVEETEDFSETRVGKDGKPYEYKRKNKKHRVIHRPPDHQAAFNYLERRFRSDWGKQLTLVLGVDVELAQRLVQAIQEQGKDPAQIFEMMIQQAAMVDASDPD